MKILSTEITINTPVQKVWNLFTDFDSFHNWNPFIKYIKGEMIIGKKIQVMISPPNSNPMEFSPKLLKYENQKEIRWIGRVGIPYIFDGEHILLFIDNKDGTTKFIQKEQFKGILVPFMKKMLDVNTKNGFELMNKALKTQCEK
jgi:hypothetical protein